MAAAYVAAGIFLVVAATAESQRFVHSNTATACCNHVNCRCLQTAVTHRLVLLPAGVQQYQAAGQTLSGTVVQLQWQVGCVAEVQTQHFLNQQAGLKFGLVVLYLWDCRWSTRQTLTVLCCGVSLLQTADYTGPLQRCLICADGLQPHS
jgi:hypothetical protein